MQHLEEQVVVEAEFLLRISITKSTDSSSSSSSSIVYFPAISRHEYKTLSRKISTVGYCQEAARETSVYLAGRLTIFIDHFYETIIYILQHNLK